jgi:hypothetical protein
MHHQLLGAFDRVAASADYLVERTLDQVIDVVDEGYRHGAISPRAVIRVKAGEHCPGPRTESAVDADVADAVVVGGEHDVPDVARCVGHAREARERLLGSAKGSYANGVPMADQEQRQFGKVWRVLAHRGDGGSVEVENHGAFDELVVDDWLHIEQMDAAVWWLRVGDARLWVTLDNMGQATVDVERGFHGRTRGTTRTGE